MTRQKTPDPLAKEAETSRPRSQRKQSWLSGPFPLRRMLMWGVRVGPSRLRRAGPRWHSAWCLPKGPMGRARLDPRPLQRKEEGAWPGARVP